MSLELARPVEISPMFSETYTADGADVGVTIGCTDARIMVRIEGPGLGEFVFVTMDPRAFAALTEACAAYKAGMEQG